jgi:hypothetical protein
VWMLDDMIEACERQVDHRVLEWTSTVNNRGYMMRPMSLDGSIVDGSTEEA